MRWGDKAKFLLDMHEETGTMPEALQKRPHLEQIWQFPYTIWQELSGSRQQRFQGIGEIPFSEVALYCKVYEFTNLETQDTWEAVHLIDLIWVNQVQKLKESSSR